MMIPYLFSIIHAKDIKEIELDGNNLTLSKLIILTKNTKCILKVNSKAFDNLNSSV